MSQQCKPANVADVLFLTNGAVMILDSNGWYEALQLSNHLWNLQMFISSDRLDNPELEFPSFVLKENLMLNDLLNSFKAYWDPSLPSKVGGFVQPCYVLVSLWLGLPKIYHINGRILPTTEFVYDNYLI